MRCICKTDIQPLINEGATREDLSASIFQAVVNQTISGLACGKPIRGHVAFLGGPLHFLSELKEAFIRTLKLDDEHIIAPENSHLFAAIGSALNYKEDVTYDLSDILDKLSSDIKMEFEVARMEPLFATQADYDAFTARHNGHNVKTADLLLTKETAILELMPVPPQPKLHWQEKTVLFSILSIAATTEVLWLLQSNPSRKSIPYYRRMHILYTPAPPVMERLY